MYLEMGGKGKEAMDRRPNKWGPWKVLERERGTEDSVGRALAVQVRENDFIFSEPM